MIDISKEICMGLSDNEIAYRYSLSIEFVRRQRKFLEPRAPVLPQQLKKTLNNPNALALGQSDVFRAKVKKDLTLSKKCVILYQIN